MKYQDGSHIDIARIYSSVAAATTIMLVVSIWPLGVVVVNYPYGSIDISLLMLFSEVALLVTSGISLVMYFIAYNPNWE